MPFRFVHTADIHLDSPLKSLSLRNRDLADLIGDATRKALVRIVDLCLEEKVDALLIAGDLYDGDQTSMKTARFLASQMERLHEAGIRVFKIRGNHDALSKITQQLVLPPSVKVFGASAETVEIDADGLSVAIHGMSFAKPHAPDSLLPKYRPALVGAANIGLMHTSLAGAIGHDPYAPCTVADLQASGFDYWALGHIHQRAVYQGPRTIVMPGIPQGRDINEAGEKSVSLVTISDDRSVTVEERLTGIAQFERIGVDVTGATDWRELVNRLGDALEIRRADTRSEHLVARLSLSGATELSWAIRRDLDLLLAEAEQRADRIGKTWIDKIELGVTPPAIRTSAAADPVVELGDLMHSDVMAGHGFREEVREMVKELLDDLPAESRGFSGHSEEALEGFIDTLIREGGEDVIARLKNSGEGDE